MKTLILLLLALLSLSCIDTYEDTIYELNSNQPYTIHVNVIPTEDVVINLERMYNEVNADYYNRYGIQIELHLLERQPSTTIKVSSKLDTLTVFVLPYKAIAGNQGTLGYALVNSNIIALREDAQSNRTLAHEIGHIFGLNHIIEHNNVMLEFDLSRNAERPLDFNEEQITTIINNLNSLSWKN